MPPSLCPAQSDESRYVINGNVPYGDTEERAYGEMGSQQRSGRRAHVLGLTLVLLGRHSPRFSPVAVMQGEQRKLLASRRLSGVITKDNIGGLSPEAAEAPSGQCRMSLSLKFPSHRRPTFQECSKLAEKFIWPFANHGSSST